MDWRHKAACKGEDPELFFPVGTSKAALEQEAAAKIVCGRCVVRLECGQWALNTGTDFGVWGGMSETERKAGLKDGTLHRSAGATAMNRDYELPWRLPLGSTRRLSAPA